MLVVTNPNSAATDWYRTVTPYTILEETTGAIEVRTKDPNTLKWYDINQADIILFSRPNGSAMLGFVAEAAMMGKKVIGDFDDDLFQLSAFNPASRWFDKPEVQATVQNTFKWFTWVTVSTPTLKDIYGHFFPPDRITIIPNAYNPYYKEFGPPAPDGKPIQLLWRGSSTHLEDLLTIAPVLNNVISDARFHLTMYGIERHLIPWIKPGFTHHEWNTLFRYFTFLSQTPVDWVLVPLANNRFNAGKSNIAGLEGFLAKGGAGCIAPPLPEFVRPGIINYSSQTELAEIMEAIGQGQIRKAEYVEAGQDWFKSYCSLAQTNEQRLEVLDKVRATPAFFHEGRQAELAAAAKELEQAARNGGRLVAMPREKSKILQRPGGPKKGK